MDYRLSCCENVNIDFSKMEIPEFAVTWTDCNLWLAACCIIFNPIYWNVMARLEYNHKVLSKWCGTSFRGCVLLAASIVLLGFYRDYRFQMAVTSQPRWPVLHQNWILYLGYLIVVIGTTLVMTSFWALGFTGTFLGDYFGMLMSEKVTGFPFNIISNPMYWGSTLHFLGLALVQASQAGILLTFLVALSYKVAIAYEEPFTNMIYTQQKKAS